MVSQSLGFITQAVGVVRPVVRNVVMACRVVTNTSVFHSWASTPAVFSSPVKFSPTPVPLMS